MLYGSNKNQRFYKGIIRLRVYNIRETTYSVKKMFMWLLQKNTKIVSSSGKNQ